MQCYIFGVLIALFLCSCMQSGYQRNYIISHIPEEEETIASEEN
jgi:hypothetical protein